MRAMLVAAGLGTRLDPLTRELPKPALPVGNRPVAWFACDHLVRAGFTEALVNTHHLAERLRAELERCCPPALRLRFVHEPVILGTGGGVRNAWQPQDGEDLVVVNAKLLFAPDLARALAEHRARGAIATMVLRPSPPGTGFAPVELDAERRVRRIRGLPQQPAAAASGGPYMYTGVQILSARAWRDLPQQGDIIEHAYLPWLARGEPVAAVIDESPWLDIGVDLRAYLDANLALASGRLAWPGITPGAGGLLCAPDARLGAGCQLRQVVVGSAAEIAPGASLTRVVAWPGARITRSLQDAVVTTAGRMIQL